MRRVPFAGEFDAVLNLWTSFGYFPEPEDDLRALKALRRALRPGGLLLLELIDGAWMRRHFEARRWEKRGLGWALQESRLLSGKDPACVTDWLFLDGRARPQRKTSFVRLYDCARLSHLLRRAGFAEFSLGPGLGARAGRASLAGRLLAAARR